MSIELNEQRVSQKKLRRCDRRLLVITFAYKKGIGKCQVKHQGYIYLFKPTRLRLLTCMLFVAGELIADSGDSVMATSPI